MVFSYACLYRLILVVENVVEFSEKILYRNSNTYTPTPNLTPTQKAALAAQSAGQSTGQIRTANGALVPAVPGPAANIQPPAPTPVPGVVATPAPPPGQGNVRVRNSDTI